MQRDSRCAGQFGSRMQGGKDASSPRYINTKLANLTRHIFNRADDCLLDYLNEEGLDIEPTWYSLFFVSSIV
jgi:DNA topoisomerase-2